MVGIKQAHVHLSGGKKRVWLQNADFRVYLRIWVSNQHLGLIYRDHSIFCQPLWHFSMADYVNLYSYVLPHTACESMSVLEPFFFSFDAKHLYIRVPRDYLTLQLKIQCFRVWKVFISSFSSETIT